MSRDNVFVPSGAELSEAVRNLLEINSWHLKTRAFSGVTPGSSGRLLPYELDAMNSSGQRLFTFKITDTPEQVWAKYETAKARGGPD